jgi:hypothetical protein
VSAVLGVEEIFWRDSASFCFSWKETKNVDTERLASTICQTAGYVLMETDQDIVVAQNLGDYGNDDEQVLSVIVIPKVCVTKRVVFRQQESSE